MKIKFPYKFGRQLFYFVRIYADDIIISHSNEIAIGELTEDLEEMYEFYAVC